MNIEQLKRRAELLEKIKELEDQIKPLAEELFTLVNPTPDEVVNIYEMMSDDWRSYLDGQVEDKLWLSREVLDIREIEEEERLDEDAKEGN